MSQVDILNYFPLLSVFILNILILYLILYIIVVPMFYSVLKVRKNFFFKLENITYFCVDYIGKIFIFLSIINSNLIKIYYIKNLYIFKILKNFINIKLTIFIKKNTINETIF